MARINVNIVQVEQKFNKAIANNQRLDSVVYARLKRSFDIEKRIMLGQFNTHPVTQELDAGPNATSQFLPEGNLFSFIGFDQGDNPSEIIYDTLHQNTRLKRFPRRKQILKNRLRYVFEFETPTLSELYDQTSPYPDAWNTGSWLRGIEKGISGLRHYLFKAGRSLRGSRSGPAIQVQGLNKGGSFRGVKYVSEILENFINRVRNR